MRQLERRLPLRPVPELLRVLELEELLLRPLRELLRVRELEQPLPRDLD